MIPLMDGILSTSRILICLPFCEMDYLSKLASDGMRMCGDRFVYDIPMDQFVSEWIRTLAF